MEDEIGRRYTITRQKAPTERFNDLLPIDVQVLALLGRSYRISEIAKTLEINESSVQASFEKIIRYYCPDRKSLALSIIRSGVQIMPPHGANMKAVKDLTWRQIQLMRSWLWNMSLEETARLSCLYKFTVHNFTPKDDYREWEKIAKLLNISERFQITNTCAYLEVFKPLVKPTRRETQNLVAKEKWEAENESDESNK